MSMILGLTALSDENIEKVTHDPPLIWKVIAPDDPEVYEKARRDSMRRSWVDRLFSQPMTVETLADDPEGPSIDLDEAWHGIHYLLSRDAEQSPLPLSFLLRGGNQVGNSPARVFTARETSAIHDAVSALSDADLVQRFDASDMLAKEIYPKIWNGSKDGEDPRAYLLQYVGMLRAFLSATVRIGFGMVVVIS
jgi:hypothetical protein